MRVDKGAEAEPELPPAARAWEQLIRLNETLEAVHESGSVSLYRQTLHVVALKARQYERAIEALLEELGE